MPVAMLAVAVVDSQENRRFSPGQQQVASIVRSITS